MKQITTAQLAARNGILTASVSKRYQRFGNYFGLVPTRMPNGRLMWPDVSVKTKGGVK
jgi:hypothetical protein